MGRPKGSKKKTTKPETSTEAAQAQPQEAPPEYPYLKEPAEQGAVIIGTPERESTRLMTEQDIKEAHDKQYEVSQKLRSAAAQEKDLIKQQKQQEDALKGTREELRRAPKPLWSRVADMTANGSGYGSAICIKYGFNPDETWRPEKE